MDKSAGIQALWERDRLQCLAELDRLLAEGEAAQVVCSAAWAQVCRVYACETADPPIYRRVCELMHRHRGVLAQDYLRVPEEPSISRMDRRLMLRLAEPDIDIEADVLDVFRLLADIRYPSSSGLPRGDEELLEQCVRRLQVDVEEQLDCILDSRWLQSTLLDELRLGASKVVYRRDKSRVFVAVGGI